MQPCVRHTHEDALCPWSEGPACVPYIHESTCALTNTQTRTDNNTPSLWGLHVRSQALTCWSQHSSYTCQTCVTEVCGAQCQVGLVTWHCPSAGGYQESWHLTGGGNLPAPRLGLLRPCRGSGSARTPPVHTMATLSYVPRVLTPLTPGAN